MRSRKIQLILQKYSLNIHGSKNRTIAFISKDITKHDNKKRITNNLIQILTSKN
jgi:hypothetical protein